jgi:hypothetical protein
MRQGPKEFFTQHYSNMLTLMKNISPPISEYEKIKIVMHSLKPDLRRYMMDKSFETLRDLEAAVVNIEVNFAEDTAEFFSPGKKYQNAVMEVRDDKRYVEVEDAVDSSADERDEDSESINQVGDRQNRLPPYCILCREEGHWAEAHRKEIKPYRKANSESEERESRSERSSNGNDNKKSNGYNGQRNRFKKNEGNRNNNRRQSEVNQGQAQTVSVPIIAQVQLVPAQIQNADTGANRATGQPQAQASCSNAAGQNFQQGSTTNPTT